MESEDEMDAVRVSEGGNGLCGDGLEQVGNCVKESENLGDKLLKNIDLYWEDISDRLTVSRMVSDSVIKGMVNAVEQEAADKVAAKELELATLRESLCAHNGGTNKIDLIKSLVIHNEQQSVKCGRHLNFPDVCVEHDKMREYLASLRIATGGQFKKLKKEIDGIRGCSSIRRIGSGSELVGLGGILKEKESENWIGIDRSLDALKMTMDTLCIRVDDMLQLSKSSMCEWQQECEFRVEVEAMVIQSSIRSLEEEFDGKLWDQNASLNDSQSVNWLEKMNEISSLRRELDDVLKSLCNFENGQVTFHGPHDMDHFYHKASSNHLSSPTSLWDGNGKVEESKTDVPENFDAAQLKLMSKDDLVNYFISMTTKLRRNHDSEVQAMAEKYFKLKREFLNYKGGVPPMLPEKDKEFDALRKKIPQVILKLDNILVEKEKLPAFGDNVESLSTLKDRLDTLLSENRQLRNSLTDRKNEVKSLTLQVSDKMRQLSLAEAELSKFVGNLNSAIEDVNIEVSIGEEVYKCVLREVSGQIKCGSEDSELELFMMRVVYEAVLGEAALNAELARKCEIEELYTLSMTVQEFCYTIFKQVMKHVKQEFKELNTRYSIEIKHRVSLGKKLMEKENELRSEVEEKQKLKKEVLSLEMLVEEKEKLAMEESAASTKEREKLELVSQELSNLKDHACQQQILISEKCIELSLVKTTLEEALEQIEADKVEINKLSRRIEQLMVKLKEVNEQKSMFFSQAQKSQKYILWVQTQEQECRKQIESSIVLIRALSKMVTDFECKVLEDIKWYSSRLEQSSSELNSLMKKANTLRRTLQMAEDEVDLLGDEADALSSLLEKIYVALDHYSPILQHYPGIIEILKLIRRELSGESTKAV